MLLTAPNKCTYPMRLSVGFRKVLYRSTYVRTDIGPFLTIELVPSSVLLLHPVE